MEKKSLFFRLVALVAAMMCALGASAYDFQSGNIYYKILTGNTVAVTYRDGNYNSYSGEVNIPETVANGGTTYNVTAIDQVAFYKCSNLKHVSLPKTIQQIGDLAFRNCPSLESVYCHAMTPPVMGDGVFDESVVDNLSVGVPMSELPAYENAEGWYELPLFELNYDFEQDGIFYLFGSDGTASVTQKEDHFNYLAYQGYVDIPWTVTYQGTTYMVTGISPNAFAGCDYLEGVCIGYNVKDVGTGAFDGCTSLKRVTIPESVTIIRNRAFRGCTSLETIICNAWTPPTIYAATFESSTYNNATLRVPYQRKSQYQAANYWQNFLNIEGSYDLYEALNPDGEFELESEGIFAWTTEEEGGRIYAMSSNAGVPNSTSSLTAWVYMEEANYALFFDFKAWGEGSGVNDRDACVFEIDGVEQFRYGDRDNEWETYKVDLTQGLHTLKWRYIKGDNVNPEGDYFAIDNMQIIPPEAYACYTESNTTLTFYYDTQRSSRPGTTYDLNTGENYTGWETDGTNAEVTKVVFDSSFAGARPTTTCAWFYNMELLQSITGMSYLNTSEVTNMHFMFTRCYQLTSLDLSSFNTSNVIAMYYMFYDCNNLRTIYVGNGWSTAAVEYSNNMFYGCTRLVGGQGTTWNSSNPKDKTYAHIDGGPSNPGYFTAEGDEPWAIEAYACYTPSNTTLTFYYDNLRSNRPGTTYDLNTGSNNTGWETDGTNAEVTKVVFDSSFAGARPTTTYDWFYDMTNLQSITGMSYLNTSEVTNMAWMFTNCKKLTSLDVSHFNTAKVTNMGRMFNSCSGLTSLDLSNFNTANVTGMNYMFNGCSNLTSLDLSSFNTSRVTEIRYMFRGSNNLRTIYVGNSWSTAAVTYSSAMFEDCTKLVGGQGTTYSASNPMDKTYAHIDGGPSNPGYFTAEGDEPWAIEAYACYTPSNTTLTFYYDTQRNNRPGTTYDLNTGTHDTGWHTDSTNAEVTKVVFDPSFAGARPTTTYGWFYFMQNLESITDMSYLNTSEVTKMGYMFSGCNQLTSIDVSHFNTSKVTDMEAMFAYCYNLTSLDLSSFNTSQVTKMSFMFYVCSNLRTIYVGNGWSTSAVTTSYNMFKDCTSLVGGQGTTYNSWYPMDKTYAHIDCGPSYPGFFTRDPNASEAYACYTESNTTLTFYCDKLRSSRPGTTYDLNSGNNATDWENDGTNAHVTKVVFDPSFADARPMTTYAWFYYMENLQSITGMSYLNTSDVTNMGSMFCKCTKLTSLDLSSFNTSQVTSMWGIFFGCSSLTSLDLSSFNTSQVTRMISMFYDCSSLTNLDLTSFNTSQVTDMGSMFRGCSSLRTVYVGDDWSTAAVTYSKDMFDGCTSLVGALGTTYNASNPTDKTYAHIDGGTSNPGYFSAEPEAYACYTPSNTTLTFYYDSQRSVRPGTTYDLNTGSQDTGWDTDGTNASVTKVVFDPSFAGARPTTTYDWFYDMTNLQSITGMSYLNTSEVTNMAWMFTNCKKLTSLDVSHFNTAKVTNMVRMFNSCSGLTSLDLSSFNTANVTGMNYMFNGCSNLTSLDLSSFNTSNVTDMGSMFRGSNNLRTIYVGNSWSTATVTYSTDMFYNCTSLVGGQGTTWNSSNPKDKTYAHIDGGPSNPGYFTEKVDYVRGDVDGNGVVGMDDLTALINYLVYGTAVNMTGADTDLSGGVGMDDLTTLINYLVYNHW